MNNFMRTLGSMIAATQERGEQEVDAMHRIFPFTAVLLVLAMAITPRLAQGAEFTQPTREYVHSVAGFIGSGTETQLFPLSTDSGTLVVPNTLLPNAGDLTITPINTGPGNLGPFYYNNQPDEFEMDLPPELQPGPTFKLNYAFTGWWAYVKPEADPLIWGIVSGGSSRDFSMPQAPEKNYFGATYCGFANFWADNGEDMMSANVTVTTLWQPNNRTIPPSAGNSILKAFKIQDIGSNVNSGTAIHTGLLTTAYSEVSFATYGTSGALNGGGATALVQFYGPGAIQLSGSFSGRWEGHLIAGGLVAQMVPGNPGSCPG
jgi:hypothetical protein